jgi:hypothetical protein
MGAGTVDSFRITAGRRARDFRMRAEEPDPGRVLTESDERSSMVTAWVVTPEGPGCRVRRETRWQGAGGVGGYSSGSVRRTCYGGCTATSRSGGTPDGAARLRGQGPAPERILSGRR